LDTHFKKTEACGNCSGATTTPSNFTYALREAEVLYELTITVPEEYEPSMINGNGYLDVVEECMYSDGAFLTDWTFCDITYKTKANSVHQSGLLECPGFNVSGIPAPIYEPGTTDRHIFAGGDEIKITYSIQPDPAYFADPTADILNQFFVNADDTAGNIVPSTPAEATVNVVVPKLEAYTAVQITDNNGIKYPAGMPVPDLSETYWNANPPPHRDSHSHLSWKVHTLQERLW